jgi:arylsulfatase A-like enzyme
LTSGALRVRLTAVQGDPGVVPVRGGTVEPLEDRRSRRSVLRGAFAALAAGVLVGGCSGGEELPARHVVVISIDTARADHFGFLGSETVETPNLDALAKEGIVYRDYMTVVPTTLASHVTLLTGKYPHHHGVARNGFMVNPDNEMLAEVLAAEGFRTAGFAGSFALDSRFDFAQGFDHFDEEFDVLVGEEGADQNQRSAEAVTDAVIAYLDETGVRGRLFLFAHYFDPHRPYDAPEPFASMYDTLGIDDLPAIPALKRREGFTPEEIERYAFAHELRYRAEIAYTDHHVGRLLDDLRERGVLDDAIVVVTTDHGESLWEHGEEFDHGYGVYDSTMRAVWVVRLPGGKRSDTRVRGVVASIDVLPTVLDFLGIAIPEGVDGEVVPLGTVFDLEPRLRFGQATKPRRGLESDPRWTNILKARCVRDQRLKFIQTPYLDTEELYDLPSDPAETLNILEDFPPRLLTRVGFLSEELERWSFSADPLPSHFESSQRDETIERLRSLGYLN